MRDRAHRPIAGVLSLVGLVAAAPLSAQRLAPQRFVLARRQQVERKLRADSVVGPEPYYVGMTIGGVSGAVLGMLTGGSVGALLDRDPDGGLTWGIAIGALAGSAVVAPLFVHLANHGHGSLTGEVAAAALVGGAGLALASSLHGDRPDPGLIAFALTPLAQVIVSEIIEARAQRAAASAPVPKRDPR